MLDPVPWFVGGGAQHSPEVARLLAYAATSGAEGIVSAFDLKVSALATPGSSVRVGPGAGLVLNKATGGTQQTYVARNVSDETVSIAATGSGAGRSDLVVLRIEDPYMPGEPWADPADAAVGPYAFIRVISGVAAGTTSVPAGTSGIPLARIDIPASTGTITNGMIVDLRKVARPRRERRTLIQSPNSSTSFTTTLADVLAFGNVDVPSWATYMYLRGDLAGVVLTGSTSDAEMRVRLGGAFTQTTAITEEANRRTNMVSAGRIFVEPHVRGGIRDVAIQARRRAGTGTFAIDTYSTGVLDVEFTEEAA